MGFSLKFKLVGITTGLGLIILAFSMWYVAYQQEQEYLGAFDQKVTILGQTLASVVGTSLGSEDNKTISAAFQFASQDPTLVFIALVDTAGEPLVVYPEPLSDSLQALLKQALAEDLLITPTTLLKNSPIAVGEQSLGTMVLAQSMAPLFRATTKSRWQILKIGFWVLVLGGLIIYLVVEKLTRPLASMVSISQQICQGDLQRRVKANSQDEIGQFGAAFNTIVDLLVLAKENLEVASEAFELDAAERMVVALTQIREERQQVDLRLVGDPSLESIGDLANRVGHEINNPMQSISSNTDFCVEAFADLAEALDKYQMLLEQYKVGRLTIGAVEGIEADLKEVDIALIRSKIPKALQNTKDGLGRISLICKALENAIPAGQEK